MKLTVVITLIVTLLTIASFIYANYRQRAAEDAKLPRIALNRVIKDLRSYHKAKGQFPQTFEQVQEVVWKAEKPPQFGDKGHSFTMRNYYYLLNQITPHAVTVWAVPINEKYSEGNTVFLVLYPERDPEIWKGAALEPNEVASLPANPTEYQLRVGLGLTKQESSPPNKRNNKSAEPSGKKINF